MPNNLAKKARRQRQTQTRLVFDHIDLSSSPAPSAGYESMDELAGEVDNRATVKDGLSPARIRYEASGGRQQYDTLGRLNSPLKQELRLKGKNTVNGRARPNRQRDGKINFERVEMAENRCLGAAMQPIRGAATKFGTADNRDLSDSDSDVILPSSGAKRKRLNASNFMSRNNRRGLYGGDGAASSGSERAPASTHEQAEALTIDSDSSGSEAGGIRLSSPVRAVIQGNTAVLPARKMVTPPSAVSNGILAKSFVKGGSGMLNRRKSSEPKKKGRATVNGKNGKAQVVESSDDDVEILEEVAQSKHADDGEPSIPTPKITQATEKLTLPEDDSDEDVFGPSVRSSQRKPKQILVVTDDEDEEDDLPDISKLGARSSQLSSKRQRPTVVDDAEEDDQDVVVSPNKRRRLSPQTTNETTPPQPKGKGKAKQIETPSRLTRASQPRKHRTDREKKLELITRRRNGEKITELTPSESDTEDDQPKGIYDTDDSLQALSEFEDEEMDSQDNEEALRQSIRGINRDNYDDDFVVDDDDSLGAPTGLNDIPLQFTQQAHKPLKDHFTDCVEWLVQRKINPSFAGDDPVYTLAFRKVDDEVRGLANSKFTSSIWKEDFSRALWARPEFLQEEVADAMEHPHCGACNRAHPTRFVVQFSGSAYIKETLEDIEIDSDDSSTSTSEVDEQGRRIAPASKVWHVGSQCKANAEMAHALIHWKWSLNGWVIAQLKSEGYLKAKKLAEREEWSQKKRAKFANGIVDEWERDKQIKGLWRDFKIQLEEARTFDGSRYARDGR